MCTCLKAITHMSLNTSVYRIDQISVLFIGDALFIIYFARFSPIWRPCMGEGYFLAQSMEYVMIGRIQPSMTSDHGLDTWC